MADNNIPYSIGILLALSKEMCVLQYLAWCGIQQPFNISYYFHYQLSWQENIVILWNSI